MHLGNQVDALRPYPWQPKQNAFAKDGADLGIPARVFPQWLRCTGCDYLGPLPRFTYTNTHPFRPDLAQFTHKSCPSRGTQRAVGKSGKRESPAVPAQHLLTCTNGHLDEFPYELVVTINPADILDNMYIPAHFAADEQAVDDLLTHHGRSIMVAATTSSEKVSPHRPKGRFDVTMIEPISGPNGFGD